MRILIIGGVAAGPSAAAKASRNQPDAEIVILFDLAQLMEKITEAYDKRMEA